jgi:hypothetical protein
MGEERRGEVRRQDAMFFSSTVESGDIFVVSHSSAPTPWSCPAAPTD